MDVSPYMVTGATELQQPIPEFLTGRIHSQPDLQRQQSTHDITLDTTLPRTVQLRQNSHKTLSTDWQMSW